MAPPAPREQPNVQPISISDYDPPPMSGLCTPKDISIQRQEDRDAGPATRAEEPEAYGNGDQEGEYICGAGEGYCVPIPAGPRPGDGDASGYFRGV